MKSYGAKPVQVTGGDGDTLDPFDEMLDRDNGDNLRRLLRYLNDRVRVPA